MLRWLPILALLALTGCSSDDKPHTSPRPSPDRPSTTWNIGPVINRKNYSPGMPERVNGAFDFPRCSVPPKDGPSVHYVTQPRFAPLAGTMTLEFEVIGDAELVTDADTTYARLWLYFQRRGDDWQAKGGTEFYRWWSTKLINLSPGVHTLSVPLEREHWGHVSGTRATDARFAAALNDPAHVGFTLGGGSGKGHGVCAKSGEARLVVKSFHIG